MAIEFKKPSYSIRKVKKYLTRYPTLVSIPYLIAALLTGIISVLYHEVFSYFSNFADHIYDIHPYALFLLTPLCFLAGWLIVKRFAPESGGSGIPQVMAANDLVDRTHSVHARSQIDRLLGMKTAVVKILSSLICVMGGGAIGREGPTIQISAAIFHLVGTKLKPFWPKMNPHMWIIAGGGAGIASAFNTPLGGIVYAIEELVQTHFTKFKSMLILAVIVSGLTAQWLSGPYLLFGFPRLSEVNFTFIPVAILIGLITGALGSFFGKILSRLYRLKLKIKSTVKLAGLVLLCGIAMAALALLTGKATLGSGIPVVNELLFTDASSNWLMIIGRYLGSILSYFTGCAGGIFAPSLATGAALGSQIAQLIQPQHENLMVLLGMIGFLTGVTRTPFTSFVLVLEMTDRHSAIFHMMLAALIAHGIARLIDSRSFYEHMKVAYMKSTRKKLKEDLPPVIEPEIK